MEFLGPLFYSLMTCLYTSALKLIFTLMIQQLQLLRNFSNISQLELSLNTFVSEIQLWANANKLPLNEEKTKVLMITGKRLAPKLRNLPNVTTDGVKTLKIVNSATLLGLEIDNMLSFNLHV